jgi:hypothetical protein
LKIENCEAFSVDLPYSVGIVFSLVKLHENRRSSDQVSQLTRRAFLHSPPLAKGEAGWKLMGSPIKRPSSREKTTPLEEKYVLARVLFTYPALWIEATVLLP